MARPDRWRLRFPYARSDCEALSGNCKCQFTEDARLDLRMVIGDGRSDFCIARRADLVLAKSALLPHCVASGLPVRAFASFEEARRIWQVGSMATTPLLLFPVAAGRRLALGMSENRCQR